MTTSAILLLADLVDQLIAKFNFKKIDFFESEDLGNADIVIILGTDKL